MEFVWRKNTQITVGMQTGERVPTKRTNEETTIENKLQNDCAFEPKKKFFGLHSGGVTGERSVMADDAMTRNNNRKRIASVGSTDCSKATGHPDSPCELFVGDRRSVGDPQQLFPYPQLECCADLIDGGRKFRELAVEISVQLFDRFFIPAFVFHHIVVVEMNGKPVEEVFFRFFWYTDFAHSIIGGRDIDVANLRIE